MPDSESICLALLFVLVVGFILLRGCRPVPLTVEILVKDVLRVINDPEEVVKEQDTVRGGGKADAKPRRQRRVTCTARAVMAAKAKFVGLSVRTQADHTVVFKYIAAWMRERGTHDADICEIAPLASELFWIPTKAEIIAKQAASAYACGEMRQAKRQSYFSLGKWLPAYASE